MHLPRVWAEIDLKTLGQNLRACRGFLAPNDSAEERRPNRQSSPTRRATRGPLTQVPLIQVPLIQAPETQAREVLGVVKADAYGHGAVAVAGTLERHRISMLGVGDSHEAVRLRENGITAPILVLGAVVEGEIPELIHHGITPMIHSPERIAMFERVAARLGVEMPVHLLIDTGMTRLGVTPSRSIEHLRSILDSPHLRLRGVGTHLASPVEDASYTRAQIDSFDAVVAEARAQGMKLPVLHVASSQAIGRHTDAHYDMVRIGGYLYGLSAQPLPPEIEPILSLYTQIVYLRDVPAGTSVGYGGTHRTRRPSRIATLPVGYHDGYLHALSNRAEVLIRGESAPVLGRISMDYVTIDVTHVPGAAVGDRVTLIGRDGDHEILASDLARWAGTIPYEIPCHLGNRVRRFYRYEHPRREQAIPLVAEGGSTRR